MMSVTWYNPGGGEQQAAHWLDGGATTLGIRLSRDDLKGMDGIWWELVVLLNPHDGEVDFVVPKRSNGSGWTAAIDTADPDQEAGTVHGGQAIRMAPRSLLVLR
jgi:glycogen operon protein